jgi:hypothetical protein
MSPRYEGLYLRNRKPTPQSANPAAFLESSCGFSAIAARCARRRTGEPTIKYRNVPTESATSGYLFFCPATGIVVAVTHRPDGRSRGGSCSPKP